MSDDDLIRNDEQPEDNDPDAGEQEPIDDDPDLAEPEAATPVVDVAAYQAETNRLVSEAEEWATSAEDRWKDAHAHAKDLKGILEMRETALRRLIRERRTGLSELERGQGLLPFAGTAPEAEPEAWRSVTIGQLDLPARIAESLHEAELSTIGAIADFTAKLALTEIAGIGPAAAEKIEQALEAFWAANPQMVPGVVEPTSDPAVNGQAHASAVMLAAAAQINDGALGPGVTATVNGADPDQPKPQRGRPRRAS